MCSEYVVVIFMSYFLHLLIQSGATFAEPKKILKSDAKKISYWRDYIIFLVDTKGRASSTFCTLRAVEFSFSGQEQTELRHNFKFPGQAVRTFLDEIFQHSKNVKKTFHIRQMFFTKTFCWERQRAPYSAGAKKYTQVRPCNFASSPPILSLLNWKRARLVQIHKKLFGAHPQK